MTSYHTGTALVWTLVILLSWCLTATRADAAGFAIREQSASALGNAFAGAPTGIEDITYSFFNPASMASLAGNHAAVVASYIALRATFAEGAARIEPASTPPFPIPILPPSRSDATEDLGVDAVVPAGYTMWSLTERLKLGLAVTAPFGLKSDYPEGWIGRYHTLTSELTTIDFNPMLAYRVTEYLAIGGGFRAVYAKAELTNAVDFGTILFGQTGGRRGTPGAEDGRATLEGHDWGFGGNVGIMFEPGKLLKLLHNLRLGATYRSRVAFNVEGDVDFDVSTSAAGQTLQAGGAFLNTGAQTAVDLPESVSFGVTYDFNDVWSVMGQAEWTNWSEFAELRITLDSQLPDENLTIHDWHDSWFVAVGATYRPRWGKGLRLKLGFAFDETPVPDRTRTPQIPDQDRYWVAVGVGYALADWVRFDLGYAHLFMPTVAIALQASEAGNQFRGNLSGVYEAEANIVTLQGTIRY